MARFPFPVLLIGGLVVGSALAGCATTPQPPADVDQSAAAGGAAADNGDSAATDATQADATQSDATPTDSGADTETASLPPLPRLDPQKVLHYSRSQLIAALGTPSFRRIDKGAEILRFKGDDCVVDVFLYADGPDKTSRVAHLEAHDLKGGAMDRDTCLNEIPRQRG